MRMDMLPFSGDYTDSDGAIRNLLELGDPPAGEKRRDLAPFNGDFYASDGSVHNISELSGGGGGGGGHSPTLGANGNWYEWSDDQNQYVDTGRPAQGPPGADGLTTSVNGVEQVGGNVQLAPDDIGAASAEQYNALLARVAAIEGELEGMPDNPWWIDKV